MTKDLSWGLPRTTPASSQRGTCNRASIRRSGLQVQRSNRLATRMPGAQNARLDDCILKYIGPRHLPFTGGVVGVIAAKGKTKASVIVS